MPLSGSGALIAASHSSENLDKEGDTQLSARQSPVEKEEKSPRGASTLNRSPGEDTRRWERRVQCDSTDCVRELRHVASTLVAREAHRSAVQPLSSKKV